MIIGNACKYARMIQIVTLIMSIIISNILQAQTRSFTEQVKTLSARMESIITVAHEHDHEITKILYQISILMHAQADQKKAGAELIKQYNDLEQTLRDAITTQQASIAVKNVSMEESLSHKKIHQLINAGTQTLDLIDQARNVAKIELQSQEQSLSIITNAQLINQPASTPKKIIMDNDKAGQREITQEWKNNAANLFYEQNSYIKTVITQGETPQEIADFNDKFQEQNRQFDTTLTNTRYQNDANYLKITQKLQELNFVTSSHKLAAEQLTGIAKTLSLSEQELKKIKLMLLYDVYEQIMHTNNHLVAWQSTPHVAKQHLSQMIQQRITQYSATPGYFLTGTPSPASNTIEQPVTLARTEQKLHDLQQEIATQESQAVSMHAMAEKNNKLNSIIQATNPENEHVMRQLYGTIADIKKTLTSMIESRASQDLSLELQLKKQGVKIDTVLSQHHHDKRINKEDITKLRLDQEFNQQTLISLKKSLLSEQGAIKQLIDSKIAALEHKNTALKTMERELAEVKSFLKHEQELQALNK